MFWRKSDKSNKSNSINYEKDREGIIKNLRRYGFTISKVVSYGSGFGIIRAEHPSLRIQISTYEKFANSHTELYLAFVINTEQENEADLKLVPNKDSDTTEGHVQSFDDTLDLISLDGKTADLILANASLDVKEGLDRIENHLDYFSISGSKLVIELSVKYDYEIALDALKFLIQFIDVLKVQYSEMIVFMDEKEYSCVYCRKKINIGNKTCPHCNKSAPMCIICHSIFNTGDSVIQYECCNAYAHLDHALKWKEMNENCPSCRAVRPKFNKVV